MEKIRLTSTEPVTSLYGCENLIYHGDYFTYYSCILDNSTFCRHNTIAYVLRVILGYPTYHEMKILQYLL
jgi:UDP-2,3-diacylglucosamine pyrophosphatase LpxH